MRFRSVAYESSLNYAIEKFFRKLAGMADLEDALNKLDNLTQEEARMALSEVLKITQNTRDEVKVVDGKVEIVGDKVEVMGDKVADVSDKVEGVNDKVDDVGDKVDDVGDKVHCVDEKVQVVIDGAPGLSTQSLIPSKIYTFRRKASERRGEGNETNRSTDGNRHGRSQVFVIP